VVVPAFHGGLLGDPGVLPVVARLIDGEAPGAHVTAQGRLRIAAEAITDAAVAWRMPDIARGYP
jgi:hypothetical protein